MDSGVDAGSALRIARMRSQYLVAGEHPDPPRLRAWLDDTVRRDLPGALAARLSVIGSETDPGLWFVRRLELELNVNGGWNRDQVAAAWAGQLMRALAQELQEPSATGNVMWFPDRAAYLAQFLVDLAAGTASNKWYYRPFDGLRMLPTSAALRTAVCDQPALGLAALMQLSHRELATIVRVLSAHDARRVLQQLADAGTAGDEVECFRAVWTAWQGARWPSADESSQALGLYVLVCRTRVDFAGHPLANAVIALLRLARCLDEHAVDQGDVLLGTLIQGELADLYTLVGAADAEVLSPLLRCPPEWLREVGQRLLPHSSGEPAHAATLESDPRQTEFGGIFLLLPLLDALPLAAATAGWPDVDDIAAEAVVRLLLLIKCCGHERAPRVFSDALIRDLSGVVRPLSLEGLRDWPKALAEEQVNRFLTEIDTYRIRGDVPDRAGDITEDVGYLSLPESMCRTAAFDHALSVAAETIMRSLAWRLPGFVHSSLPYLYTNFLDFAARLEDEPARRVVRLSRPPLHLVLALTGITRSSYRVTWLGERPFVLFPDG